MFELNHTLTHFFQMSDHKEETQKYQLYYQFTKSKHTLKQKIVNLFGMQKTIISIFCIMWFHFYFRRHLDLYGLKKNKSIGVNIYSNIGQFFAITVSQSKQYGSTTNNTLTIAKIKINTTLMQRLQLTLCFEVVVNKWTSRLKTRLTSADNNEVTIKY